MTVPLDNSRVQQLFFLQRFVFSENCAKPSESGSVLWQLVLDIASILQIVDKAQVVMRRTALKTQRRRRF